MYTGHKLVQNKKNNAGAEDTSSAGKIIEGQFPTLQRFSSSQLVVKTVESRFPSLSYLASGSTLPFS
jgi:hypothetical protein